LQPGSVPRCTRVNAKKLRFVTRYTLALEGSINYGVETSSKGADALG